ncbi:unnamed protein product [Prorocentrum cordatum]|uniref:Galectin n=1 Tax=Prorocentrum cordatum TaxID=2364126 RepID=A0ABN9XFK7_9DINO|nr:unnamed protein product [Polarella glacialis]
MINRTIITRSVVIIVPCILHRIRKIKDEDIMWQRREQRQNESFMILDVLIRDARKIHVRMNGIEEIGRENWSISTGHPKITIKSAKLSKRIEIEDVRIHAYELPPRILLRFHYCCPETAHE